MPDTATAVKRKVVMPPRTGEGIAVRAEANFVKIPARIRKRL